MLGTIEAELATAPRLTVKGANGQTVAHPLLGEARRSRAQVAALLKAIGLEDPSQAATGRGSRTSSESARRAAMTRQYGHGHGLGA